MNFDTSPWRKSTPTYYNITYPLFDCPPNRGTLGGDKNHFEENEKWFLIGAYFHCEKNVKINSELWQYTALSDILYNSHPLWCC
jgi:hypothetical protein